MSERTADVLIVGAGVMGCAAAYQLAKSGARPLAHVVDEKAIVNAMVGLLATGGSTNHFIHLPAIARAAIMWPIARHCCPALSMSFM